MSEYCSVIKGLEMSDYQMKMCDGALKIRPLKGKEPNRFHRFMQGLILGFKWSKV